MRIVGHSSAIIGNLFEASEWTADAGLVDRYGPLEFDELATPVILKECQNWPAREKCG